MAPSYEGKDGTSVDDVVEQVREGFGVRVFGVWSSSVLELVDTQLKPEGDLRNTSWIVIIGVTVMTRNKMSRSKGSGRVGVVEVEMAGTSLD